MFTPSPGAALLGLLGQRDSLLPDRGLERLVRENVACDQLEDSMIPLHVTATDLLSGEERRLSSGDAVDAVVASASIPGVFPAVRRGSDLLVDGGVSDNTPISHAVELGAEEIYVLPTGGPCALERPPKGALGALLQAITVLVRRRLVEDVERFADHARLVVLPPPCPLAVQPADFGHTAELIDAGWRAAGATLDGRPGATTTYDGLDDPHPLRPHEHEEGIPAVGDHRG